MSHILNEQIIIECGKPIKKRKLFTLFSGSIVLNFILFLFYSF